MYKDWKVLAFVPCFHPFKIWQNGRMQLVRCNSCPACRNSAKASLSNQLRAETSTFKYCFFLTLTYDEQNIPRYVVNWNAEDINNIFVSSSEHINFVSLQPITPRILDNPRLYNEYIYNTSKKYGKSNQTFAVSLREYLSRRSLYSDRYNTRHPFPKGEVVDLVLSADIQNFIKRLRQFIKRKFNEKIRVYSISEYGTESLRPHFHSLLFFNSSDLAEELNNTITVQAKRKADGTIKEYTCASCLCSLWRFGVITSEQTDGNVYGYVSNYVTGSSRLPELLKISAKPRSYHSVKLGSSFTKNYVEKIIQSKKWYKLQNVELQDYNGFIYDYTVPRQNITSYLPSLGKSVASTPSSLRAILELCSCSYAKKYTVNELANQIYSFYQRYFRSGSSGFYNHFLSTSCNLLKQVIERCSPLRLSPLTRVLYASNRYLKTRLLFRFSLNEMWDTYCSFYKYISLFNLRLLYEECQKSDSFSDIYYKNIYLDDLSKFRLYNDWFNDQQVSDCQNIKHLKLASLYSNI